MSRPLTAYAAIKTVGDEAISLPKSTFCTFPPERFLTGVEIPGVDTSSRSITCSASSLEGFLSAKKPFPLL